jgi:predicted RNA-binding Zn ribbon-like protein
MGYNCHMTDRYDFVKMGDLSLDFINSKVMDTRSVPFYDLFSDYEHILYWCRHLGLINDQVVDKLQERAKQNPMEAQQAFVKLVQLRDANYQILTAFARQQEPVSADLEVLNQILREASQHRTMHSTKEGIQWSWDDPTSSLDWMAWPLAFTTAELLTSDQIHRIRECSGCYWMFMDTSRNGMRRWCDMKTCGNRAKAHRHYERIKTQKK